MDIKDFPAPLRLEARNIEYLKTIASVYKFRYTHDDKSVEFHTDKGQPIDKCGFVHAYCGAIEMDDGQRLVVVIFGTPHFGEPMKPLEAYIVYQPADHMQKILSRAIEIASIKREG